MPTKGLFLEKNNFEIILITKTIVGQNCCFHMRFILTEKYSKAVFWSFENAFIYIKFANSTNNDTELDSKNIF